MTSHPVPDFVIPQPPPRGHVQVRNSCSWHCISYDKLDICKVSGLDQIAPYCLKEFCLNVVKFVECLAIIRQASLDQSSDP